MVAVPVLCVSGGVLSPRTHLTGLPVFFAVELHCDSAVRQAWSLEGTLSVDIVGVVHFDFNGMVRPAVPAEVEAEGRDVRHYRGTREGGHTHVDHIALSVVHQVVRSLVLAREVKPLAAEANEVWVADHNRRLDCTTSEGTACSMWRHGRGGEFGVGSVEGPPRSWRVCLLLVEHSNAGHL